MLQHATIAFVISPKLSGFFTDLILLGIMALVAFGIFCLCMSWVDLQREKKELSNLMEKCQNGKFNKDEVRKLLENDVPEGLKENHPAEHITHRRLKVICDMLEARYMKAGTNGAESNINLQTPQMSDLHQLSEQAILSYWAPTSLNVITAILLICGICGTLWGVHGALQQGIRPNLQAFAPALNPSKLAVFASVFLIMLRCWYAVGVDRFLRGLDRITMTLFLPSLVPSSDNSLKINKFFSHIEEYTHKLENSMVPVRETASGIHNRLGYIGKQVREIDNDCETLLFKLAVDVTQACETLVRREMPALPEAQSAPPLPDAEGAVPSASKAKAKPKAKPKAEPKAEPKSKRRKATTKNAPAKGKSSPPPLPE